MAEKLIAVVCFLVLVACGSSSAAPDATLARPDASRVADAGPPADAPPPDALACTSALVTVTAAATASDSCVQVDRSARYTAGNTIGVEDGGSEIGRFVLERIDDSGASPKMCAASAFGFEIPAGATFACLAAPGESP